MTPHFAFLQKSVLATCFVLIIHFTPVFAFDRLPQFLKRIDLPLLSSPPPTDEQPLPLWRVYNRPGNAVTARWIRRGLALDTEYADTQVVINVMVQGIMKIKKEGARLLQELKPLEKTNMREYRRGIKQYINMVEE